jgi:phosphoribosylanthranilate isomerase
MLVQIYETQDASEARALEAVGVDHIGVLVGRGRYAREIRPAQASQIFQAITQARRVALSLADDLEEVIEVVAETLPDILHLGTVPEGLGPEAVAALKTRFPALQLMRTIPVINEESLLLAKQYDGLADYLLLDTYQPGDTQVGATGAPHDWDLSRRIVSSVRTPVILAGGLGPENVAEAIRTVRPAGVDSKTRTDRDGGPFKDIEQVRAFVQIAKSSAECGSPAKSNQCQRHPA